MDTEETNKRRIKKSNCNFALLQAWYENTYITDLEQTSPKKRKTKNVRKVLVVIISDFESFNDKILQDFILIIRYYNYFDYISIV